MKLQDRPGKCVAVGYAILANCHVVFPGSKQVYVINLTARVTAPHYECCFSYLVKNPKFHYWSYESRPLVPDDLLADTL
jgi:hypothetical protein